MTTNEGRPQYIGLRLAPKRAEEEAKRKLASQPKHEAIEKLEFLRDDMMKKLDKDGFDLQMSEWLNTVAWLLGYFRVKIKED